MGLSKPALAKCLQDTTTREDLNTFIYTYIATKGAYPKLDVDDSTTLTVTDLARATVTRLVASGANIDIRETQHGPTALHNLCWRYSKAEYFVGGELSSLFQSFFERLPPERAGFIRFLVEQCGADPTAKWHGRTTSETLKLGWERLGEREKALAEELVCLLESRDGRSPSGL